MEKVKKILRSRCLLCKTLTPIADLSQIFMSKHEDKDKKNRVCPSCKENSCRLCEEDGRWYPRNLMARVHIYRGETIEEMETVRESWMCHECIDEEYFSCDGCSDVYEHPLDNGMCPRCSLAEDGRGQQMNRDINFREAKKLYDVARKTGNIIKSTRKFGIEFELVPKSTEYGKYNVIIKKTPFIIPKTWGITTDASLSSGGIEVQTAPMRLELGEKSVMDFCALLPKIGWGVNETCGIHVHLDGADLLENSKLLRQAFITYFVMDRIILAMLPAPRRKNRYCSPMDKKLAIINRMMNFEKGFNLKEVLMVGSKNDLMRAYYKAEGRDLEQQLHNHQTEPRYYGINFHALFSGHGTVEIRYHEGSVSGIEILYWTAFHQHILDNARKVSDDTAIKISSCADIKEALMLYASITGMPEYLIDYARARVDAFSLKATAQA